MEKILLHLQVLKDGKVEKWNCYGDLEDHLQQDVWPYLEVSHVFVEGENFGRAVPNPYAGVRRLIVRRPYLSEVEGVAERLMERFGGRIEVIPLRTHTPWPGWDRGLLLVREPPTRNRIPARPAYPGEEAWYVGSEMCGPFGGIASANI